LREIEYDDHAELTNCGPVTEPDSTCDTEYRLCDNSTCDQHCPRKIIQGVQYYTNECDCPEISCPADPGSYQDDVPVRDCYHDNYEGQEPCRCVGVA
jgi:hypothetical protein